MARKCRDAWLPGQMRLNGRPAEADRCQLAEGGEERLVLVKGVNDCCPEERCGGKGGNGASSNSTWPKQRQVADHVRPALDTLLGGFGGTQNAGRVANFVVVITSLAVLQSGTWHLARKKELNVISIFAIVIRHCINSVKLTPKSHAIKYHFLALSPWPLQPSIWTTCS